MAAGVHLSLLLLTADSYSSESLSGQQKCINVLRHCIESFSTVQQKAAMILKESYISILASSSVKKHLNKKSRPYLGKWVLTGSVDTTTEGAPPHISSILYELIAAPESKEEEEGGREGAMGGGEGGDEEAYKSLTKQIHHLMDSIPLKGNEYTIADVHWLAAGTELAPPSGAIGLYGALLRVTKCLNAHVEMVVPDGCRDLWRAALREWEEAVGVARVWSASHWAWSAAQHGSQPGCIWRGSVGVIERKSRQATQLGTLFPGFSLHLSPDVDERTITPAYYEAVGLSPSYYPSHLQYLFRVELSSIPTFWYSPLKFNLCVSSPNAASMEFFKSLRNSSENIGHLFCLCQSSTNPDPDISTPCSGIKTKGEWTAYIKTSEDILEEAETQMHSLASYEYGPILLVSPRSPSPLSPDKTAPFCLNEGVVSCDAWFLWRYDTIASLLSLEGVGGSDLEKFLRQHSDADSRVATRGSMAYSSAPSSPVQPVATRTPLHCHELDMPPSDWSETKALRTHDWIERKMVRRVPTSELMFGQLPAPPPVSVVCPEVGGVTDMLACFSEHGEPLATTPLSPIAVTTPSKPTRMHNAAIEDLTYQALVDATPTSKKRRYHGIDYCFSDSDSSMDSKLTKIQNRYLISERASHCSTISTPRDLRLIREARKRKAGLRAKSRSEVTTQSSGVALSTQGQKRGMTEIREVNPLEVASSSSTQKSEQVSRKRKVELQDSTSDSSQKQERGVAMEGVSVRDKSKGKFSQNSRTSLLRLKKRKAEMVQNGHSRPSGVGTETALEGNKKRNSAQDAEEKTSSQKGEETKRTKRNSTSSFYGKKAFTPKQRTKASKDTATLDQKGASPEEERGKERLRECMEDSDHSQSSSSGHKRKRKPLKTLLGETVVKALKKNGMPRDHPKFRACYNRLFNLSKSFMEEYKSSATTSEALSREMVRVVNGNANNVISFQQRLSSISEPQ